MWEAAVVITTWYKKQLVTENQVAKHFNSPIVDYSSWCSTAEGVGRDPLKLQWI